MEFETSSTLISTATKTLPPSWMTDFPQATSFIKKRRHELDGSFNPRSNSDDGLSISFDINTVLDSALSVMTTTFTTMGNTKCDTSYLFCPTGTCYTGVNGYIGCCTVSSCSARTTCIPYHESQRSCNEDSEGCIFCSDPKTPACYTMSNWWETPTQWALWCTDTSSATNYLYPNSYIDGQILAAMPTGTFTPSWPGSSSTSEVPLTIVKSGSIYMTFNGSDSTSKTSTAQVTSTATNGSLNMTSNAAGLDFNTSGIVGIAVGSSFALVAMIAFITFLIRSYRRNKARDVAQEPQFQNQLPRGTLGGAVLPGTWLDKDGEDDRATDGLLLTSNQNQNTLISDRNTTAGNNPELAETTVPEYTRELANSQISMSSSAKGRVSGSVNGFQPYKPPYSPMDIHRPAAPYSNAQASHSEPTVTSYNRSRPTSEIFGRVDSPSWTQYGSAYDQQNRVSAQAMSSGPQAISPVTASVSVHSTDQLILQNHSGCLISPMSTSYLNSTPSSPREIHDSARDVLRTGLIQSAFNTPSANNSLLPPSLLSSLPATPTTSVNQNFSNVAPERISSLLTELHSGQLSGSVSAMEDGLSARGDWKGWVSPESALAEGLWQSEVERMHEDDRELNGMEKSEEKKI